MIELKGSSRQEVTQRVPIRLEEKDMVLLERMQERDDVEVESMLNTYRCKMLIE